MNASCKFPHGFTREDALIEELASQTAQRDGLLMDSGALQENGKKLMLD